MIQAPRKPTPRAIVRRTRITSPSATTASSVANSGPEKPSAEALASGVSATPAKNITMVAALTTPRTACSRNRLVRSGAKPFRKNTGASTANPNTQRKNATSNACRPFARKRIPAFMPVPISAAAIISATPLAVAGVRSISFATRKRANLRATRNPGARRLACCAPHLTGARRLACCAPHLTGARRAARAIHVVATAEIRRARLAPAWANIPVFFPKGGGRTGSRRQ